MNDSLHFWVRNDKGQVFGPLTAPSVELLLDNGVISGRMQISSDGITYVYPGMVPGVRTLFPRETWGDVVVPGDELDAEWSQVVMPAAVYGQTDSAPGQGDQPNAMPTAGVPPPEARAAPSVPVAGPGALSQADRPLHSSPLRTHAPASSVSIFPAQSGPPSVPTSGPSQVAPGRPPPQLSPASSPTPAPPQVAPARPLPQVAPARPPPPVAPARPPPQVAPAAPELKNRSPAPAHSPSAATAGEPIPAIGTLEQLSPQRLYYLAAAQELTGLLTLKLTDRELVLHFKKGNPEFLDSTHDEDSLAAFLLAQKLATQAQIDQATAQASRFGGDLASALFGLGLVNPNSVFQHLAQRASRLLTRVLTAEQGTFCFDREDLPPERSMPMGHKWAVYVEALRRQPAPDIRRRMAGALELPVMKTTGLVALSDVRLIPQETRALHYFDGVRSLLQITKDTPAESDIILRTAWMLAPLELVSIAAEGRSSVRQAAVPPPVMKPDPPPTAAPSRPPPVVKPPPTVTPATAQAPGPPPSVVKPAPTVTPATAQPPRPAPVVLKPAPTVNPATAQPPRPAPVVMKPAASVAQPASSASASGNLQAELKQLQALHESMKKQSFFEVLGLKRDADAGAVKSAYLKAAKSYHPDTVAPGSPEALAQLKASIFALIGEANRTLSDPALREDYLTGMDLGASGSNLDVEKILRAEELFGKGRLLMQARKYSEALKTFEEAIAMNPDEGEFYAWRGYARFLVATDKRQVQSEAMRDLNLCLSKNPNVASAYYFLGFIAKSNGDEKGALGHFKKCVALDPKHIDAQRELRSARK